MRTYFVYMVSYAALWLFLLPPSSVSQESGCDEQGDVTVEAFFGWPLYLSCLTLNEYCIDAFDSGTVYCIMTDLETNGTIFNVSYDVDYYYSDEISHKLPVVTNETTTSILISVTDLNGTCCSQREILQTTELTNYTCDEFSNLAERMVNRSLVQGAAGILLLCESPDDSENEIVNDFNVTWYYNCGRNLPTGVERSGKSLLINSTDYKHHPGIYTCSINNGVEERFIRSHHVCVEPLAWADLVSIRCTSILTLDVGDTINIDCTVDIGDGEMNPERYAMRFFPLLTNGSIDVSKDNVSCTSFLGGNRTIREEDNRVSCVFSYEENATDPQCFSYIPTDLEWEENRNKTISKLRMLYQMTSLRRENFGDYLSEVSNTLSMESANDTTIVREADHPERRALIIGCTVGGIVLLLVIVAIIYFAFRLEVLIWWRHTPFSKVEKNPQRYGAYLAYYWNRGENAASNDDEIRDLILGMYRFLEKEIHCPLYDQTREMQNGGNYDSTLNAQQNSDRILVVLSPGYIIAHQKNNFEMYTNFHEIPFVFVKTPGVDKAIDRLPENIRNALRIHLKRSVIINWKPNRRLQNNQMPAKFRMKLELAMPKRQPTPREVIYQNDDVEIRPQARL